MRPNEVLNMERKDVKQDRLRPRNWFRDCPIFVPIGSVLDYARAIPGRSTKYDLSVLRDRANITTAYSESGYSEYNDRFTHSLFPVAGSYRSASLSQRSTSG